MSDAPLYRTPAHRRRKVAAALEALTASRRVILTTHLNADGDGTGSQVALGTWLRALGAQVRIVNPTPFPEMYSFLLEKVGEPSMMAEAGGAEARAACARADLAVVLDTGEVQRIGRVKPMIEHLKTLVIDHHPPGDQPIGGISFRDPDACATGELVYDVMLASGGPWPEAALEGLYTAILTDTGSFRFSNSTPGAHRVVADLIAGGVEPERMHKLVYGSAPLRRFELLREALETLEVDEDGRVAWMTIPGGGEDDPKASADDLEGIVDYPRMVRGVEVGLLFRAAMGGTKISFRSNGPVDVNALARRFGGGGHVKASGALVDRGLEEVIPEVVHAAREAVQDTLGALR
ncbi:MAG: bifunctional oligoribonuclease/PAP phosphatase NrnA [Gemmatimonadetes bacterium]|nr:bifunctional oligoribonuclease/PAP phosphatase NrnA [Gemmatimonadota bacterium]